MISDLYSDVLLINPFILFAVFFTASVYCELNFRALFTTAPIFVLLYLCYVYLRVSKSSTVDERRNSYGQ